MHVVLKTKFLLFIILSIIREWKFNLYRSCLLHIRNIIILYRVINYARSSKFLHQMIHK